MEKECAHKYAIKAAKHYEEAPCGWDVTSSPRTHLLCKCERCGKINVDDIAGHWKPEQLTDL